MDMPEKYISKMKDLLKDEFEGYLASFLDERLYGIRVNTLKMDVNEFCNKGLYDITPIKWCDEGFYYNGANARPSKSPYYHAGLYYLQEPSAMSTASVADIKPGDRVLDVCAAPGGKSTQAGAKLKGDGILVTNDISTSRTKALLKNIELFGITNAVILNESPDKIADRFPNFFDKIIIDAPCSGEGMFRKDPDIIKAWGESMTEFCVSAQKEILEACARAVCDGGYIIYSTCTFDPAENENQIDAFLSRHSEFELCEIPKELGLSNGHPEWCESRNPELIKCGRLWPHKIKGEGHFVAKLRKKDNGNRTVFESTPKKKIDGLEYFDEFIRENIKIEFNGDFEAFRERLYLLPKGMPTLSGLRTVRNGWHLGDIKKKRFEPSQAFAMGLKRDNVRLTEELSDYDTAVKYLKGETLETNLDEDGWVLVTFDGLTLGWAKSQNGRLKNKYFPGWKWE
ncbi:MAG: RsmB/NOP family class I SAM-dependent RNA methyltransferase [Candidatus Metalachnospira sp.]|nr:RsmB/NOP family class I SAM-dependent RNA methyltransferase [Candidatus Metalachnospira sp.]